MSNTYKKPPPSIGPAVEVSQGMGKSAQANDGQDMGFLFQ